MKSNKYKATVTLALVSAGFLASYPFSNGVWGGLATSGFEAAMVGGLADWFAVTALFRKPLGIPYRTALIPRNRERIFNALADMVENELLTKENIKKALDNHDISSVVLHFMEDHGGKEVANEVTGTLVNNLINNINTEELGQVIGSIIKDRLAETDISPLLAASCEWLVEHGYDDTIMDFIIQQLAVLAGHPQIKELLTGLFLEALEAYERGLSRRILFNQLLNFSPAQIAQVVQDKMVEQIDRIRYSDHPLRQKAKKWMRKTIDRMKDDAEFKLAIEDWKQKQLARVDINNMIANAIRELVRAASSNGILEISVRERIKRHVDKLLADFAVDTGERTKVDRLVKNVLGTWLDVYHKEIGLMVRSSLNQFSNEMLSEFLEQRVGNDLQMIRINGSVVGGLAGMLIYLLTFWI